MNYETYSRPHPPQILPQKPFLPVLNFDQILTRAEIGGHGHEKNGHRCPYPRHGHGPRHMDHVTWSWTQKI